MRTRLTLQPGQDGAKQLGVQYGDRLVCVRHRYDEQEKKRLVSPSSDNPLMWLHGEILRLRYTPAAQKQNFSRLFSLD